MNVKEVEAYIRKQAAARGIDPDTAVRVARSEGLSRGTWQSNIVDPKRGREPSYGPFQLLEGGSGGWPRGMGNDFKAKTGMSPSDPRSLYPGIDFALDNAVQGGWGPWYGAKKIGITGKAGIGPNARPLGMSLASNPISSQIAAQPPISVESGGAAPPLNPAYVLDEAEPKPQTGLAGLKELWNIGQTDGFKAAIDAAAAKPGMKDGFTSIMSAMGGGQTRDPQAEAHATPIPSSMAALDGMDATRMGNAQQMMTQLLAARRKRVPGLSMMG
jgi:hypothetical protein